MLEELGLTGVGEMCVGGLEGKFGGSRVFKALANNDVKRGP